MGRFPKNLKWPYSVSVFIAVVLAASIQRGCEENRSKTLTQTGTFPLSNSASKPQERSTSHQNPVPEEVDLPRLAVPKELVENLEVLSFDQLKGQVTVHNQTDWLIQELDLVLELNTGMGVRNPKYSKKLTYRAELLPTETGKALATSQYGFDPVALESWISSSSFTNPSIWVTIEGAHGGAPASLTNTAP